MERGERRKRSSTRGEHPQDDEPRRGKTESGNGRRGDTGTSLRLPFVQLMLYVRCGVAGDAFIHRGRQQSGGEIAPAGKFPRPIPLPARGEYDRGGN